MAETAPAAAPSPVAPPPPPAVSPVSAVPAPAPSPASAPVYVRVLFINLVFAMFAATVIFAVASYFFLVPRMALQDLHAARLERTSTPSRPRCASSLPPGSGRRQLRACGLRAGRRARRACARPGRARCRRTRHRGADRGADRTRRGAGQVGPLAGRVGSGWFDSAPGRRL
jgi:hypothetical protein